MAQSPEKHTHLIKSIAHDLGFMFCGIAKARFLEEEAPQLETWLQNDMHGRMSYMANHFDKRLDPTQLVPGAKSVVSLIYNYYPNQDIDDADYKLAKYAYGKDYHFIIKDKLKDFMSRLTDAIGQVEGRVFVDSAPVMERQWAALSGIGWTGKNSLLLNRQAGSFFFLAELILDLELLADGPAKDYCGTCTACLDACPTDAIAQPYVVDASKCISYLTIELKDNIPSEFADKMEGWMFGCDICQDVCPWNRFARPHQEPAFEPHPQLADMTMEDWHELSRDTFNELFKKSAVKRAGFNKLSDTIQFIKKTSS